MWVCLENSWKGLEVFSGIFDVLIVVLNSGTRKTRQERPFLLWQLDCPVHNFHSEKAGKAGMYALVWVLDVTVLGIWKK